MALKDWEKGKTEGGHLAYYNKKNTDVLVFTKGKKDWNVRYGEIGQGDYKSFKSKSQALKFAREYMKTH